MFFILRIIRSVAWETPVSLDYILYYSKLGGIFVEKEKSNFSMYWKEGIVLLFMFGFRFLPPVGGITPYGMAVLGILIGAVLGWSFDSQTMLHSSLLALVALATAGYPGGMEAICTNLMAQSSLIIMCLGMVLAGALVDAGVDNYLIAKIMNMKFAKGKPWMTTFVLMLAPFILSIFITNSALIIFLLPIYAKLMREAGYQPGDKYVINLFLGAILAANCSTYLLPFRGLPLAFQGMARAYTGVSWTYAQWMMSVSIYVILVPIGFLLFMKLIGCDPSKLKNIDITNAFGDPNATISKHQKSVLGCMLAFLIGSIIISFGAMMNNPLGKLFGMISVYGWLMIIMSVMMIVRVDGRRLLNLHAATSKGFTWDLILLVASATLVGSALTSAESGMGAALTKLVAPMLGGLGPVMIVIAIFTFALIATNVANNMAILMICYAMVAGLIAGGLPINGSLVASGLLIFSMWGFLLPSSSMWGAIIHTADMTTPGSIYKNVILLLIYILVTMAVIFVPLGMWAF